MPPRRSLPPRAISAEVALTAFAEGASAPDGLRRVGMALCNHLRACVAEEAAAEQALPPPTAPARVRQAAAARVHLAWRRQQQAVDTELWWRAYSAMLARTVGKGARAQAAVARHCARVARAVPKPTAAQLAELAAARKRVRDEVLAELDDERGRTVRARVARLAVAGAAQRAAKRAREWHAEEQRTRVPRATGGPAAAGESPDLHTQRLEHVVAPGAHDPPSIL